MKNWQIMNNVNIYYLKYNIIPNLISFGLAFAYYNKIILDCSLQEYVKNVLSLFNVVNINNNDIIKIVDNILYNRYRLLIINVNKIELINIKN